MYSAEQQLMSLHQEQSVPAPALSGSQDSGACRVFLVEDNLHDRYFAKRLLEASSEVASVKCFADGKELIDYMTAQGFQDRSVMCMTPTIIITDLNMPRMDGFKVLERLKSDLFLEDIPIVVVSDDLCYKNVRQALDLRADGVFRKPISVEKLRRFFAVGWQWPTREMWMA
jgi:CheY-like chemotaxis protein